MPLLASVTETTDAPATLTTTYVINPGDTFSGTYSSGADRDVIAVNVVAGQTYTVSLTGLSGTGGAVPDTYLRVMAGNGAVIAEDDDGGPGYNSQITFTATSTGYYYLEASQFGGGIAGSYSLGVATGSAPLPLPAPTGPTATIEDMATQLTHGYWASLGYNGVPRAFNVAPGGTLFVDLTGLTPDGQRLARAALDVWTQTTGINFSTQIPQGVAAHIVFDDNDSGAYASFETSGRFITSAFVNVSTAWLQTYGTGLTSYSFQTYVHEIGHALGLGHAGNYNGSAIYGRDQTFINDSWQLSVMSYFDQQSNWVVNATRASVITPMTADLLAIQSLYGTATNLRTGNTTYGENSTAGGVYDQFSILNTDGNRDETVTMTIVDNGGIDTLDFRRDTNPQRIDLRPGQTSDVYGHIGTLSIALGTTIENVFSGSGSDHITGNAANNLIRSFAGADTVYGGNGNDTIEGGANNDALFGGAGFDLIFGGTGNDYIEGGAQADRLHGEDGNDSIYGGQGLDIVYGDAGNDLLYGGADQDRVYGGIHNDTIYGGDGDDLLYGGAGFDTIFGGIGNDYIEGGAQADRLNGDDGNDTLFGGQGLDVVSGDAGDDLLYGGEDQDWVYGGIHNDTIYGGDGNDLLFGGAGFDSIFGGTGNDHIDGGAQADRLNGDDGNDTLYGGQGLDVVSGDAGDDVLYGGADQDFIYGGINNDLLFGDDGNDFLFGGAGFDTLYGGEGNDRLNGEAQADRLFGGNGNDTLLGEQGVDLLDGGAGNDILYGGTENDTLIGGAGDDMLYGGAGADRFVFGTNSGVDVIGDFSPTTAGEVIALVGIAGMNSYADVMAATTQSGGNTIINLGGGNSITLINVAPTSLAADDFVFV